MKSMGGTMRRDGEQAGAGSTDDDSLGDLQVLLRDHHGGAGRGRGCTGKEGEGEGEEDGERARKRCKDENVEVDKASAAVVAQRCAIVVE